jgi:hypothetical protein
VGLEDRARRRNQEREALQRKAAVSIDLEGAWGALRSRQARRVLSEFVVFMQKHRIPPLDLYLASHPGMGALLAPKDRRKAAKIAPVLQAWKIDERRHHIRDDVMSAVAVTSDLRAFRSLMLTPSSRRGNIMVIDNVFARNIPPSTSLRVP